MMEYTVRITSPSQTNEMKFVSYVYIAPYINL